MTSLRGKRVAMVVAPRDFRDEELEEPHRYLSEQGVDVVIACAELGTATGKLGATVEPKALLADVEPEEYDGIVFVGGGGSRVYFDDARAQDLSRRFLFANKLVGAICIAPAILANAGLLAGRNATSFESERDRLRSAGATVADQPVVVDGRIVTAEGPAAARLFGEALAGVLANVEG